MKEAASRGLLEQIRASRRGWNLLVAGLDLDQRLLLRRLHRTLATRPAQLQRLRFRQGSTALAAGLDHLQAGISKQFACIHTGRAWRFGSPRRSRSLRRFCLGRCFLPRRFNLPGFLARFLKDSLDWTRLFPRFLPGRLYRRR